MTTNPYEELQKLATLLQHAAQERVDPKISSFIPIVPKPDSPELHAYKKSFANQCQIADAVKPLTNDELIASLKKKC